MVNFGLVHLIVLQLSHSSLQQLVKSKTSCSPEHETLRSEIMKKSKCTKPSPVFHPLLSETINEVYLPEAVWVNRCLGFCDDSNFSCLPMKISYRFIPVRVSNARTGREYCSTYEVEEHASCGCCQPQKGGDAGTVAHSRQCQATQETKEIPHRHRVDSDAVSVEGHTESNPESGLDFPFY